MLTAHQPVSRTDWFVIGMLAGLTGLALIVVVGCGGVTSGARAKARGDTGDMQTRLASIRQLHFQTPVAIEVAKPNSHPEPARGLTPGALSDSDRQRIGAQIGFPDYAFRSARAAMRSTRVDLAGFYDPDRGRVVLLAGPSGEFPREVLLAHELTHALQYQNFPIGKMFDEARSYDRYLAFNAIIEGDAMLTSLAYARAQEFDRNAAENLKVRMRQALSSDPTEPSLSDLIEYYYGTLFVVEAFERGGWDGVNHLYSDPPESSREILEPALYFDRSISRLNEDDHAFVPEVKGWREIGRDTLGVVPLTAILARKSEGNDRPVRLSLRWVNDRLVAFRKDDRMATIWTITFEDSSAAWAFEQSYQPILDRSCGSEPHRLNLIDRTVVVSIGGMVPRLVAAATPG